MGSLPLPEPFEASTTGNLTTRQQQSEELGLSSERAISKNSSTDLSMTSVLHEEFSSISRADTEVASMEAAADALLLDPEKATEEPEQGRNNSSSRFTNVHGNLRDALTVSFTLKSPLQGPGVTSDPTNENSSDRETAAAAPKSSASSCDDAGTTAAVKEMETLQYHVRVHLGQDETQADPSEVDVATNGDIGIQTKSSAVSHVSVKSAPGTTRTSHQPHKALYSTPQSLLVDSNANLSVDDGAIDQRGEFENDHAASDSSSANCQTTASSSALHVNLRGLECQATISNRNCGDAKGADEDPDKNQSWSDSGTRTFENSLQASALHLPSSCPASPRLLSTPVTEPAEGAQDLAGTSSAAIATAEDTPMSESEVAYVSITSTEHPMASSLSPKVDTTATTVLRMIQGRDSVLDNDVQTADFSKDAAKVARKVTNQLLLANLPPKNAPGRRKCLETDKKSDPRDSSILERKPCNSSDHGSATLSRNVNPMAYSFVYTQVSSQDPSAASQDLVSPHPRFTVEGSRSKQSQSYRTSSFASEDRSEAVPHTPFRPSPFPVSVHKEKPELEVRPSIASHPLLDRSHSESEAFSPSNNILGRNAVYERERPDSELTPFRHSNLNVETSLHGHRLSTDFGAYPTDGLVKKPIISSAEAHKLMFQSTDQGAETNVPGATQALDTASFTPSGDDQNSKSGPFLGQISIDSDFYLHANPFRETRKLPTFRTAGVGAAINPSETHMQKANELLASRSNGSLQDENCAVSDGAVIFKTAGSMSNIVVSERSLYEASEILGAISRNVYSFEKDSGLATSSMVKDAGTEVPTAISVRSLREPSECLVNSCQADAGKCSEASFRTAGSGTRMEVSESNLREISERFAAWTVPPVINSCSQDIGVEILPVFMTEGSATRVVVPESAILEANVHLETISTQPEVRRRDVDSGFGMLPFLKTGASGSHLAISEASPMQVKERLGINSAPKETDSFLIDANVTALPVFKTAGSGTHVTVSEASLQKATEHLGTSSIDPQTSSLDADFSMFKTAGSGTSLVISEESLQKATEHLGTSSIGPQTSSLDADFSMFKTAGSGTSLVISEESLQKASEFLSSKSTLAVTTSYEPSHDLDAGFIISATTQATDSPTQNSWLLPSLHGQETDAVQGDSSPCLETPAGRGRSQMLPLAQNHHLETSKASIPSSGASSSANEYANLSTPAVLHRPPRVSFASHVTNTTHGVQRLSHVTSVKGIHTPAEGWRPQRVSFSCVEKKRSGSERKFEDYSKRTSYAKLLLGERAVVPDTPMEDSTPCHLREDHSETEEGPYKSSHQSASSSASPLLKNTSESGFVESINNVTLKVNSLNSTSVRFDRATKTPLLILDSTINDPINTLGSTDDYRRALAESGLDVASISDKWITNHTRWIVWKLASIERRFLHLVDMNYLNFDRVVEKLKIRFGREFTRGERSPLRMMLNRDVSASTMTILCVARMIKPAGGSGLPWSLELTDGWYSVNASLDMPLSHFVEYERIAVGSKLLVSNATLVGFDEGVDPLDPSYDVMDRQASPVLSIVSNATRLACWDAKLGFVRPTPATLASEGLLRVEKVSDVIVGGGRVPLIDFLVVRRYPILYREKKPSATTSSDSTEHHPRTLTESEEAERRNLLEKKRQDVAEAVKVEVEAECSEVS
jgi:breast cancer 2 susceptibility protein